LEKATFLSLQGVPVCTTTMYFTSAHCVLLCEMKQWLFTQLFPDLRQLHGFTVLFLAKNKNKTTAFDQQKPGIKSMATYTVYIYIFVI